MTIVNIIISIEKHFFLNLFKEKNSSLILQDNNEGWDGGKKQNKRLRYFEFRQKSNLLI